MSLRRLAILSSFALVLAPAAVRAERVSLPKGTTFDLRLVDSLSSDTARVGDRFRARLAAPVALGGDAWLPEDTIVEGHVVLVRAARDGAVSGALGVQFDRIQPPGGDARTLRAGLASRRHDDDRLVREPYALVATGRKIDVVFIGRTHPEDVRAHTLVGIDGQDAEGLADDWSRTGLGPSEAAVPAGAIVKLAIDSKAKIDVPQGISAASFAW